MPFINYFVPDDVVLVYDDFRANKFNCKIKIPELRYRLLRDDGAFLTKDVDYTTDGLSFTIISFTIAIDSIIIMQFY